MTINEHTADYLALVEAAREAIGAHSHIETCDLPPWLDNLEKVVESRGTPEPYEQANAARIAECVNAMEGVEDPAAFMAAVKVLVKEARVGALNLDLYVAGRLDNALYFFRTFIRRGEDV